MSDNDTVATVFIFIAILLLLGLPLALLIARDRSSRLAVNSKEAAEYSRKFEQRLQTPDFEALAKHFGCPVPPCIQALYADQQELLRFDFEVAASAEATEEERWFVAWYEPADAQSVRDTWPKLKGYFAFANDGGGNSYFVDPKGNDPPVLFHDHETGEISPVCNSFTEFMRWPRLEVKE